MKQMKPLVCNSWTQPPALEEVTLFFTRQTYIITSIGIVFTATAH